MPIALDLRALFFWGWVLAIVVFLGMALLKRRGTRRKWAVIGLSLLAAFVALIVLTTGEFA